MRYDASAPHWPNRDRFVLSNGHASILQYSMLYLTGLRPHPRRPRGLPPVGLGRPPATPRCTTPPASRSPPARSARASPTPWAWRWPSTGSGPASDRSCSTTTPSPSAATATSRRASATRRPRSPATSASASSSSSTTTTTSPSTAPPSWPSPTTRRRGSPPTAGTSRTSARSARTSTRSRPPCARAMDVDDRPSLIVLRSHIGYPSPKYTDTAARPRQPPRRRGDRRHQGDHGRCPTRPFWVPDDVLEHMRAVGPRGRAAREAWEATYAGWTEDTAELDAGPRPAGASPAGRTSLPTWEAGEKVATRNAGKKVAQRPRCRWCPASSAAAPTSPATPGPRSPVPSPSPGRPTATAASSTSASASTPWARS